MDAPKARRYQQYGHWAQIVSMTAAVTGRAWTFPVRVFQWSPPGPRVYLY